MIYYVLIASCCNITYLNQRIRPTQKFLKIDRIKLQQSHKSCSIYTYHSIMRTSIAENAMWFLGWIKSAHNYLWIKITYEHRIRTVTQRVFDRKERQQYRKPRPSILIWSCSFFYYCLQHTISPETWNSNMYRGVSITCILFILDKRR